MYTEVSTLDEAITAMKEFLSWGYSVTVTDLGGCGYSVRGI